jgi:hypothetical protein
MNIFQVGSGRKSTPSVLVNAGVFRLSGENKRLTYPPYIMYPTMRRISDKVKVIMG